MTSNGTVLIEGSRGITVDARTGPLELKGSNVSIKGSGGVTVEGATVSVTGQGSAELTASGTVTVQGSLVRIN